MASKTVTRSICFPVKHLGILKNSVKCPRAFQIELEFASVVFWREKKTGVPGEKPLGARERTNGKTQPTYGVLAGNQTQAKLV